jgi:hypothetical protein
MLIQTRTGIRRFANGKFELGFESKGLFTTTIGSHSRTLEIDPQRAVERELKGPFLRLTH